MVNIPDSLRSVFSATVRTRDGSFVIEVPSGEVDADAVAPGETYRVAVVGSAITTTDGDPSSSSESARRKEQGHPPEPPVSKGDIRDVTIETIGEQGDGIAKVERGYVVIVPGAEPGDAPTVEIEQVQQNVAFATIIDSDTRT